MQLNLFFRHLKKGCALLSLGFVLLCPAEIFATEQGQNAPFKTALSPSQTDDLAKDIDKIVSGEAPVPILSDKTLATDLHERFDKLEQWFSSQRHNLFILIAGAFFCLLAGSLLAALLHWLIKHPWKHFSGALHWQLSLALAGPAIVLLVISGIFAFMLPVLHSLPGLYPFDVRLFFTAITVVSAWAVFQLIAIFDTRMHAIAKRNDNNLDCLMVDILRKTLKIAVIILTLLFIGQSIFELNITTMLAGAGVLGLAVAFASKETLSNFFGTLVIVLDTPFRIGDRVRIGEMDGIVESVGMRSTRIRTAQESLCVVPNNQIAEQPVENISNHGKLRHTFDIGLDYNTAPEQLSQAIELLHTILDNFHGPDATGYEPRIFFEKFGASALNIRVIIWLKTIDYAVEEQYKTEINLAILKAFNRTGLNMPFATTTTYLVNDPQRPFVAKIENTSEESPLTK